MPHDIQDHDPATTMRVSVLREPGVIAVERRPVPTVASGDVLVEVASVGVCGSDVHYYRHGSIGDFVVEAPLILGHEAGGRIVAVGEGVDAARVGQRVSIEPQRPCGACRACRSGAYNLCPSMEFYATPPIDGAFAELVTIGSDFAHPISDAVSDHAAALIEPLSVGIAAVQKASVTVGDVVLVAGGGPIGILTAQAARAFGARRVVVSEPHPVRRSIAERYGFEVVDPTAASTDDLAADACIDASGVTAAILAGLRSLRPGGTLVLVGSADVVPLPVAEVAMREIVVTGIFRYVGTWPLALSLVERGIVELDSLVTHEYGLEQVEEALDADASPTSLKRIVLPAVARVAEPEVAARVAQGVGVGSTA